MLTCRVGKLLHSAVACNALVPLEISPEAINSLLSLDFREDRPYTYLHVDLPSELLLRNDVLLRLLLCAFWRKGVTGLD